MTKDLYSLSFSLSSPTNSFCSPKFSSTAAMNSLNLFSNSSESSFSNAEPLILWSSSKILRFARGFVLNLALWISMIFSLMLSIHSLLLNSEQIAITSLESLASFGKLSVIVSKTRTASSSSNGSKG